MSIPDRSYEALIARLAPQATLGFDPARAQAFKQNPASMRRAA